MGWGILKTLIRYPDEAAQRLPECREAGNGLRYTLSDALKSALAVFYFPHQSLLNFQWEMRRKTKQSNLEILFGVIPCTGQMRNIADDIEPGSLSAISDKGLKSADERGTLEDYRILDGGVLIPLDGVWYHASEHVHCDHCPLQTKEGKTSCYHSMTGTAVVRPGSGVVPPLMPEHIRNEDGQGKRDRGRNGISRSGERGVAVAQANLFRG
jgi:hypothetical protein